MALNEECLKSALEDLERAASLIRKSNIIDDIDPAMKEAFLSPDMWLWSFPEESRGQKDTLRAVFLDYPRVTETVVLEFADLITREALERFADCECAARQPAIENRERAHILGGISPYQTAPRKITEVRVRRGR